MRKMSFLLLLFVCGGYALDDMTFANTYVDSQVLTHTQLNQDNDSTANTFNKLNDSLEARFMRTSNYTSGDSSLSLFTCGVLSVTDSATNQFKADTLTARLGIYSNNYDGTRLLLESTTSKQVQQLASLTDYVAGTASQITVTDDGDGTITLSTPQSIDTSSDVHFDRLYGNLFRMKVDSVQLSSNAATLTSTYNIIQSEVAGTDTLSTITIADVQIGDVVILQISAAGGAQTIFIDKNTGNITGGTDRTLDAPDDTIILIYKYSNNWYEISFTNGS